MYLTVGLIVLMNVIKDLSWEWESWKMKKMSSMKHFQKKLGGGELGLWCILSSP